MIHIIVYVSCISNHLKCRTGAVFIITRCVYVTSNSGHWILESKKDYIEGVAVLTLSQSQWASLSVVVAQSFIPTRNAPCTHPRGFAERIHTKSLLPSGTQLLTSSITLWVQAMTSSAALVVVVTSKSAADWPVRITKPLSDGHDQEHSFSSPVG